MNKLADFFEWVFTFDGESVTTNVYQTAMNTGKTIVEKYTREMYQNGKPFEISDLMWDIPIAFVDSVFWQRFIRWSSPGKKMKSSMPKHSNPDTRATSRQVPDKNPMDNNTFNKKKHVTGLVYYN
jgi:hypothetical protein